MLLKLSQARLPDQSKPSSNDLGFSDLKSTSNKPLLCINKYLVLILGNREAIPNQSWFFVPLFRLLGLVLGRFFDIFYYGLSRRLLSGCTARRAVCFRAAGRGAEFASGNTAVFASTIDILTSFAERQAQSVNYIND